MTSSMLRPRRWRALCSPRTQRSASTMLDLPQPLGPTIPVMPSGNSRTVRSLEDLKPVSSSRLILTFLSSSSSSSDPLGSGHYTAGRRPQAAHPTGEYPTWGKSESRRGRQRTGLHAEVHQRSEADRPRLTTPLTTSERQRRQSGSSSTFQYAVSTALRNGTHSR